MSAAKPFVLSPLSLLKTIIKLVILLIILLVGGLTWVSLNDRADDYDVSLDGVIIPQFDEQTIDFSPTYDKTRTLPFAGSAIIDVDNDGVEEVFFGGGMDQMDAFYRFTDGSFSDITESLGWTKQPSDKTFGAVALDLDADGDTDMLVTRQSGVWLYTNSGDSFDAKLLDLDLDEQTVPLSVAVSDLNRDGQYDLFVAGYIARRFVEGETIFNKTYGGVSDLYLNTGNDTFEKITAEAGMEYQHNTFMGVFIDIDNDTFEDLIVAHDTGQIRTWKNNGDMTFTNMPNPSSDVFSYPMGIGVTDYGSDGSPDFFLSNVGSTTPDFLVRGDLRDDQVLYKKWFMLESNDDFTFNDVADTTKVADYEFSWGGIFEDFNLDGLDDLVVSENYVGFPLHAVPFWRLDGRFLLQTESGEFAAAGESSGVRNREYGITPLTADFNGDGYPDLVHVNLAGPQRAFISKGGDQGYLKVKLPNTVASVGARVSVELEDGTQLNQYFVIGEGLVSDQSHTMIFGLNDQHASKVTVRQLDGTESELTGEFRNELLTP